METPDLDLKDKTPKIRMLNDIRDVVYDKDWLNSAKDFELYYMYGDLIEDENVKYSITVVPPNTLGNEFIKTKGHAHIGDYQETYTVLEGEAIYLMQKTEDNEVKDVYAVKAKQSQSIIIPEGYGHVTINASNQTLKTGDWRHKDCKSDYSMFEKLQGACYYYVLENGGAKWIKNENYKNIPELRFEEPLESLPENLDFLKQ